MIAKSLHLSARELDIVRCVFDDHTEPVIAEELGISAATVHTYLGRVYSKLSVGSRVQLVVRIIVEYFVLAGCQGQAPVISSDDTDQMSSQ